MNRNFAFKRGITFRGEPVPRADPLADIAAEDPVPHFVSQLNRDVFLELDRKKRNAAACIDGPVWKDAIGGTGFDTACARAAVVGHKGGVRLELEVKQDFGKQEIRAMLWMNETGILADPADACPLSEITLEDGACIGIPAVYYGLANFLFDELNEFFHPVGKNVMIVIALSVGGDAAL